jgi:hypothetical protein
LADAWAHADLLRCPHAISENMATSEEVDMIGNRPQFRKDQKFPLRTMPFHDCDFCLVMVASWAFFYLSIAFCSLRFET